jgi:von Willebrand factor type A domain
MSNLPNAAVAIRAALLFAVCLLTCTDDARGDERDLAVEFKAAKANLTQQLRDRKKENRLAAVRKLETYPIPDSAKLLLFQGLSSTDEDVRRASFDVLTRFNGDKEICTFLKTTVAKQWRQGKPQAETFAGLAVLLASDLTDVREEATELVKEAAERPQGRNILIMLADELSSCRGDSACRSLLQLMSLPLFTDDFGFRRAVEQALVRVRSKDAVTALIKLVGSVKGEVRADIVRYLTDISGQQLGIESPAWTAWWEQAEKKFEFPPETKPALGAAANQAAARPPPPGPTYYGLPLSGARIIFVIDTSGSMNGPRIVAAKRELSKAVEELPADVEFNIIAFNGRTYPWQAKLIPATPDSKQNALYFIAAQGLASGTASYDALEAALRFDGEAIYFLTDGAPFGGKITKPPDIVREITRINQYRRLTINAIGIGVGLPGNAFDTFLSALAQQNFGEYQRVDQ